MKIALLNQYSTYPDSLPITVLRQLCGNALEFTHPGKAALIIAGPFRRRRTPLRKIADAAEKLLMKKNRSALRLFHTYENFRHDTVPADYAISSDLGVVSESHFRLPYWMESLNWAGHGTKNKKSERVRRLLDIDELMVPLGGKLLQKPKKAAIFCAHLKEPRRTLYEAMSKVMPTKGFGRAFSPEIQHHDSSGFYKDDILAEYAINLCPENSLYPGYCTEKIVDAFGAGCLPVTWADPNVSTDFNPKAFVNAHQFASTGYEQGLREALTDKAISERADEPLFVSRPAIEPFIEFMRKVIADTR